MEHLKNINEFLDIDMLYSEFGIVNESSLTRMLRRIKNHDWAILTAFRDNKTEKENIRNNQKIISELNELKLEPYILKGHWQEAPDGMDYEEAMEQGKIKGVSEDSILVVNDERSGLDSQEFFNLISDLAFREEWKQDAIIIGKGDGSIHLMFNNQKTTKLGNKIGINKIDQAYSTMKKKQKNIPFVFEGVLSPSSISSRMVLSKMGLNWFTNFD